MGRTRGWAVRIGRTVVRADRRRVRLPARGWRRESSLDDLVRVVPEPGAGAWLSAETLSTGVAGNCGIFSVRSPHSIRSDGELTPRASRRSSRWEESKVVRCANWNVEEAGRLWCNVEILQ